MSRGGGDVECPSLGHVSPICLFLFLSLSLSFRFRSLLLFFTPLSSPLMKNESMRQNKRKVDIFLLSFSPSFSLSLFLSFCSDSSLLFQETGKRTRRRHALWTTDENDDEEDGNDDDKDDVDDRNYHKDTDEDVNVATPKFKERQKMVTEIG